MDGRGDENEKGTENNRLSFFAGAGREGSEGEGGGGDGISEGGRGIVVMVVVVM